MTYLVPERLYRTVDGRLVRHGDPEAAFLAHPAGQQLSDEEATRMGVIQFVLGEGMRGKPLDKSAGRTIDKDGGQATTDPIVPAMPGEPVTVVEEEVEVGPVGGAIGVEPKPVVLHDPPAASRRSGRRPSGGRY